MKPIRTIRTGACVLAAACALAACTQPGPTAREARRPRRPTPGAGHDDARCQYALRDAAVAGNTLPPGATGGDPADVPPPA